MARTGRSHRSVEFKHMNLSSVLADLGLPTIRGDGAGYDIRSFDPAGGERLIEVKATRGGPATDFFLTRTEREVSAERPDAWRLYRLHDLAAAPGLFQLKPPLEEAVTLTAETWRAGF